MCGPFATRACASSSYATTSMHSGTQLPLRCKRCLTRRQVLRGHTLHHRRTSSTLRQVHCMHSQRSMALLPEVQLRQPYVLPRGCASNLLLDPTKQGLLREDLVLSFGSLTRASFPSTSSLQPLVEFVSTHENVSQVARHHLLCLTVSAARNSRQGEARLRGDN